MFSTVTRKTYLQRWTVNSWTSKSIHVTNKQGLNIALSITLCCHCPCSVRLFWVMKIDHHNLMRNLRFSRRRRFEVFWIVTPCSVSEDLAASIFTSSEMLVFCCSTSRCHNWPLWCTGYLGYSFLHGLSIAVPLLTSLFTNVCEGVSKSFRTGRLERELQMVQLSATRCSCIAILWVWLVSFAAITLCVASQRMFIVVVYFVINSARKLLDTPSYTTNQLTNWMWKILPLLLGILKGTWCFLFASTR
jgi:hypothetical protein